MERGRQSKYILLCSYQSEERLQPIINRLTLHLQNKETNMTVKYEHLTKFKPELSAENLADHDNMCGVMLVHFTGHGRFVITDHPEALYHEFFLKVKELLSKSCMQIERVVYNNLYAHIGRIMCTYTLLYVVMSYINGIIHVASNNNNSSSSSNNNNNNNNNNDNDNNIDNNNK